MFADKKEVTITGTVPAAAKKIIFTADTKKLYTYFSVDGKGACPEKETCTKPAFIAYDGADRVITISDKPVNVGVLKVNIEVFIMQSYV